MDSTRSQQLSTHGTSNQQPALPSSVVHPTRTDTAPQQGSTMPGDGAAVHVGEHPHHERHSGPNDRVLEAPADRHEKVPFKEQVIGVAKKTRGTVLGKPELKEHGEKILEGEATS